MELVSQEKALQHPWCCYLISENSHDYEDLIPLHMFHAVRFGAIVVSTALKQVGSSGDGKKQLDGEEKLHR